MFRGYNVRLSFSDEDLYQIGLSLHQRQQKAIRTAIDQFISVTGKINGNQLQEAWFPQVCADVFLSHSHQDKRLAITLAGWLQQELKLDAFVDSAIWEYAGELLRDIDNAYCYNAGTKTYSYDKRNRSTAHVHMMLSTSLAKMMDHCECLFFLNTPQSLDASSSVTESKTFSPWLYYEIATSALIGKPLAFHPRRTVIKKSMQYSINESARDIIEYELEMSHLTDLLGSSLTSWKIAYQKYFPKPELSLDILYELFK